MKKLLAVLLTLMLVLSLTACGGKGKSLSGTFYIYEMTVEDETADYNMLAFIEATDTYIKFNGDGTGEMYMTDAGTETFKVDEEKGTLTFDSDGSVANYERVGSKVTVTISSDVVIVFERDGGSTLTDAQNMVTYPMDYAAQEWWLGDWYGRWTVFDGDGYYADMVGGSLDCCVFIEQDADPEREGYYLITVWDEEYNDYFDKPLAKVVMRYDPGAGRSEYGTLVSIDDDDNSFFYGEVEAGDWVVDPDYAGFDNMLIIEGSYTDDESEYCEYGIVLTKWGYEWDYDATTPPYYYYDYFLPMMDVGDPLPVIFEPWA